MKFCPILPNVSRFSLAMLALVTVLALLLAPGPAARAQADKPPQDLLDEIDADFSAYWPAVAAFESDYAGLHAGRYYQLLPASSSTPADGERLALDKLTAGPTDQNEKNDLLWAIAGLPATLDYQITIDTYAGPLGAGYVVNLSVVAAGRVYQRSLIAGPELDKTPAGWVDITPTDK